MRSPLISDLTRTVLALQLDKVARSATLIVVLAASVSGLGTIMFAQRGSLVLFGDVKIDNTNVGSPAPSSITVILYKDIGGEIGRQNVANGSRYRFSNLTEGDYELAIEADNNEAVRLRVAVRGLSNSPYGFQQDLEFVWKPKGPRKLKIGNPVSG